LLFEKARISANCQIKSRTYGLQIGMHAFKSPHLINVNRTNFPIGTILSYGESKHIFIMGERIIVVEDDKDIQYLLKNSLSKAGYEVEILPDGDTLIRGNAGTADLFLLDVNLPGINGLELCRFLKLNSITKNIPVIILSAFPGLGSVASKYYADDSLEKPFNFSNLIGLITKHIHKND
jgi:CheY-like chemotaxis protein